MQNKTPRLIQPTVGEFIEMLQRFPKDAVITEENVSNFVGCYFKYSHSHWDDDGFGHPVDYKNLELEFFDARDNS